MPTQITRAKSLCALGTGAVIGFGAVLALKACFPKAAKLPKLVLEKLGFEASDLFCLLESPESFDGAAREAARKKAKPKKRRKTVGARRAAKPAAPLAPSPVVSAGAVREAWHKVPAAVRRASGLWLDAGSPERRRREVRAAAGAVHPRRARAQALDAVDQQVF